MRFKLIGNKNYGYMCFFVSQEIGVILVVVLNGTIEDFRQGGLGDCWYLASIKAISVSVVGQSVLSNLITVNGSNLTVNFDGAESFLFKTTTTNVDSVVSKNAYTSATAHVTGDAEVVLLEMAMKNYNSQSSSFFNSSVYNGGYMSQALSILTGVKSTYFSNFAENFSAVTAKLDELADIIDHTAITCSCDNVAAPALGIAAAHHAYSVVAIDKQNKTVSFRNPWDSGTAITPISYANFSKYFQTIQYVDFSSDDKCLYATNKKSSLVGGSGNDDLYGGAEGDTLNGGAGIDYMYGGKGNDVYYIDTAGDYVNESANSGTDTIISSISYTLGYYFENLTMTGSSNLTGIGNLNANIIKGNSGNNNIYAYDGNDTIDGGAGNDNMSGGAGNDVYYVDNVNDSITESSSEGTDSVFSSASFSLSNNIEKLILTGSSVIYGYGNDLSNFIKGNSVNNILDGGTAGNDTLRGFKGDDTYIISHTGISITENAAEGTDTIKTSISFTLADNFENLTLTGSSAINGRGNAIKNIITGNSVNNVLAGGGGKDTLIGGSGNDTYIVGITGVVISETLSDGTDLVESTASCTLSDNVENLTLKGAAVINGGGNVLTNIITGNIADNLLDGGIAGNDSLYGGKGNDTYIIDRAGISIYENASEGNDLVKSAISYTLATNFEKLKLTGTLNINGTGNEANNIITGNSLNNILDGATGNDTLTGGIGNDTYYVDSTIDAIVELAAQGTDLVFALANYKLANFVENLTLDGTSGINAIGNSLANYITGNLGDNQITGGLGKDTLCGAGGNDIYKFAAGDGIDTIEELGGNDVISFASSVLEKSIAFFKDGLNLICAYSGANRITIQSHYTQDKDSIEKIELSTGRYITAVEINTVIDNISAYAVDHRISITSVDNVLANKNLMTLVSAGWHA